MATHETDMPCRRTGRLARCHECHTDRTDALVGFRRGHVTLLDEAAQLLDLQGTLRRRTNRATLAHFSGWRVRVQWETDDLNSYQMELSSELVRHHLGQECGRTKCVYMHASLRRTGKPHLHAVLGAGLAESGPAVAA